MSDLCPPRSRGFIFLGESRIGEGEDIDIIEFVLSREPLDDSFVR